MKIAIVCPCHNEEAVLESSAGRLSSLLSSLESEGKISDGSFLMFVDDGSQDATWETISNLSAALPGLKAVRLGANAGQQTALYAGLMQCRGLCDACVTLDVDLQDDINCIPKMLDACAAGADVVYGVRTDRSVDSAVKRMTAGAYYALLKLFGAKTIPDHGDFRLMTAPVLEALAGRCGRRPYLRGLVPQLGFASATVAYKRLGRESGCSSYSVPKMFRLAADGFANAFGRSSGSPEYTIIETID